MFDIEPGEDVHETVAGDCYLRVGDETRRLSFSQRRELEYDRGPRPFDGTVADAAISDVDPDALAEFQKKLGSASPASALRARNLLTPQGDLTVAGYLLFSTRPQTLFPNAYVRVLRYTDTERGTGRSLNLADDGDVHCEGSLAEQIAQARATILKFLPKRRALTDQGLFSGIPIIPEDAWLEALVNAVVHRSNSIVRDHIRVEVFPDRIEVSSPGRFPGLADPTDPTRIARHARNPRIARVLADLGVTQELEEGIRRILVEMRQRGLTDPIYTQTQAGVHLTLSAADTLSAEIRASLPHAALVVLDQLRIARRPLGTGEVAELAGIARPTAGRHLKPESTDGSGVAIGA